MIRRKCLAGIIIFLLLFSLAQIAYAQNILVYVNGQRLFLPQEPKIEKGTVLLPLRPIGEALGAKVNWNSLNEEAEVEKGDLKIKLPPGKKVAIINGHLYELPAATTIEKGRTLVPLAFVQEIFNAAVEWDKDWQVITINSASDKERDGTERSLDTVSLAKMAESVVMVLTYDQDNEPLAIASGVVIGPGGLFVTNYHVLEGARRVSVINDSGESYPVIGVVAFDQEKDLAILKLDANLPYAPLGNSKEVKIGDQVVFIGSPLGIKNTVTSGMVSNLIEIDGKPFIQTTAPIAQGSSGGALFNAKGELIGIMTAYLAMGQNMNLAIPVDELRSLFDRLLKEPLDLDKLFWESSSTKLITTTEELVNFLNKNYSVINKNKLIRFTYFVAERETYDFEIDVLINPLDYGHWLELDDQEKLEIIGQIIKAVDLKVDLNNSFRLAFYYQNWWPFYPSSFAEEEIELGPDGESWLVTHLLAQGYTVENTLRWELYD